MYVDLPSLSLYISPYYFQTFNINLTGGSTIEHLTFTVAGRSEGRTPSTAIAKKHVVPIPRGAHDTITTPRQRPRQFRDMSEVPETSQSTAASPQLGSQEATAPVTPHSGWDASVTHYSGYTEKIDGGGIRPILPGNILSLLVND